MREAILKWEALVEVVVLWLIFYAVLSSLRGTRFSGVLKSLFFGLVVFVIGIRFLAELMGLEQLKVMIDLLLGGLALGVLVIFAPDMRRALARFAESPLLHPIFRGPTRKTIEPVVDATMRMAQNRIGALIVLERDIGLRDIIEKGVRLDAEVTAMLLESIFFPGSALHDGAVIVQGDRAAAGACFLPLSENPDVARALGTRHRAALGITEETDAIAVVVSEETGKVSLCMHGRMFRDLDRQALVEKLSGGLPPDPSSGGAWDRIIRPLTRRKQVDSPGGDGDVATRTAKEEKV